MICPCCGGPADPAIISERMRSMVVYGKTLAEIKTAIDAYFNLFEKKINPPACSVCFKPISETMIDNCKCLQNK